MSDNEIREVDNEIGGLETVELNDLLENLSFSLMEYNISQQITNNSSSLVNFLDVVIGKFHAILDDERIDEMDKSEIKSQMIDFCQNIIERFAIQYNLAINLLGDDYESNINTLSVLYDFFVTYRSSHTEDFLINYIRANKTEIVQAIGKGDYEPKDVTSMSYKKKHVPQEDVIILSSIDDVIQFVSSLDIDPEEFLNMIDDGQYDTSELIDLYNDSTICGNFVPVLMADTVSYDTAYYTNIRNSIRIEFNN